jgi:hypothetical protein
LNTADEGPGRLEDIIELEKTKSVDVMEELSTLLMLPDNIDVVESIVDDFAPRPFAEPEYMLIREMDIKEVKDILLVNKSEVTEVEMVEVALLTDSFVAC